MDQKQQIANSTQKIGNEAVLIYRKTLFFMMSWFAMRVLPDWKESFVPYDYYDSKTGSPRSFKAELIWMNDNIATSFNKFEYMFLKYLVWKCERCSCTSKEDAVVYIDCGTMLSEIQPVKGNTSAIRNQMHKALEKFSQVKFKFGTTNHIFRFVNSFRKWSVEEKSQQYEGYEIELNRDAFTSFLPFKSEAGVSDRRILYPFHRIFKLYNESRSKNFFIILDRILTLPGEYSEEEKIYRTRLAPNSFLRHGYGRKSILVDVKRVCKEKGLFNVEEIIRDEIPYSSFEINYSSSPQIKVTQNKKLD